MATSLQNASFFLHDDRPWVTVNRVKGATVDSLHRLLLHLLLPQGAGHVLLPTTKTTMVLPVGVRVLINPASLLRQLQALL